MKIKSIVIVGIILCVIGLGLSIYAATRPDFKVEEEFINQESSFGEIEKITFDGDFNNIIITKNTTNYINYYISDSYKYNINYDEVNKTLTIETNFRGKLAFLKLHEAKPFNIYISSDLKYLELDLDTGDIEIKDININTANIELDAGSLYFNNLTVNNLECNINAGYLKLDKATINKGNIELDAAKFESNNSLLGEIVITIDAGSFDHTGKILNSLTIDIDAGSVDLDLDQYQSEFIINGRGNGNIIINHDIDFGDFDIEYKK